MPSINSGLMLVSAVTVWITLTVCVHTCLWRGLIQFQIACIPWFQKLPACYECENSVFLKLLVGLGVLAPLCRSFQHWQFWPCQQTAAKETHACEVCIMDNKDGLSLTAAAYKPWACNPEPLDWKRTRPWLLTAACVLAGYPGINENVSANQPVRWSAGCGSAQSPCSGIWTGPESGGEITRIPCRDQNCILGCTAVWLHSQQPDAVGPEVACGQQYKLENATTSSASNVQGILLLMDLPLRVWVTEMTWRDVTDVFGFHLAVLLVKVCSLVDFYSMCQ